MLPCSAECIKVLTVEKNWAEASTGLPPYTVIQALAIDPLAPGSLYVGYDKRLFASTDGGGAWSELNPGAPLVSVKTLAVSPTAPAILYAGTDDGVHRSLDGGKSWCSSILA